MTRISCVEQAVRRALCSTALLLVVPLVAVAQQTNDEINETLEEVIVTGSRIPRRDFTSATPITTIDSLELKLAGITNVEDALNDLPQVVPSNNRSTNGVGGNTATINLRGLGDNRSLSLLNGRRFTASDSFGAVDLNNIPSALIERIEVVSGGASAVYGSDALTGAVNFILKKDFEGVEFNTQYDVTEEADGEVTDINISGGISFAGERGYLSGFVNFHERRPIFYSDRAFTQLTLFDDIFTGEVFASGSSAIPAGTILNPVDVGGVPAPDGVTFEQDGTPRPFIEPDDRFNYAPFNYLQMPLERSVASVFVDFELSPTTRFYGEYMFVDTSQEAEFAPSALFFEPVQMNIDNPSITPETRQIFVDNFDPDGDGIADFFLAKRLPELGSRNIDRTTELYRYVSGIEADIFGDWSFDLHYSFTESQGRFLLSNDGSRTRFHQALLVDPLTGQCTDPTDGCAPANIFGEGNISAEAADFIRSPPLGESADVTQSIIGSSLVGDIVALPAGALGFAVGVEFRTDKYEEAPDNDFSSEDRMGFFPTIPISGEVKLKEVFAEVLVPILSDKSFARYLGVEGGYRYTDHSLAGGFDTWKLAAEWEPFTGYRLRGSVQQAVRAPNASEYFEAQRTDFEFFIAEFADFCSASLNPELAGFRDICIAQGIPASEIGTYEATLFYPALVTNGGNRLLDPEVSDTVTAGIVIQPDALPNLQVSFDYYSIDIDNAIQYIDPFQTIILCFAIQIPEDPLCQAVERDPNNYNISAVTGGPRNIATLSTRGYDLQIDYEHDLPSWLSIFNGDTSLRWRILANHALENGSQPTPDVIYRDCAGFIGFPCDVTSWGTLPAYKTNTRLTYDSGPLTFSVQWLWIDGMKSAFFEYGLDLFGIPRDAVNIFFSEIPSKSYFDFSFDWEINDSWDIYGGVNNLTNTQPPLLAGFQTAANTDPTVYDVYGRAYYIGLTARFWD